MNENELDLTIDLEELELIERSVAGRYNEPAVTVGNNALYWNWAASQLLGGGLISYGLTSEYVVVLPKTKPSKTTFIARADSRGFVHSRYPTEMRNRVNDGTHKVFRYKDGVAFHRYEVL